MNLAAKYAYRVYMEKSFSAAAKALFVSQPALSSSIAHLERELGFRIFDRSVIPLSLTPEGRIYIDALEEIMECESHMRHRLQQLSDKTYGSLSIGGSSSIMYQLFPIICGEFYRRYPEVSVRLDMGGVGNLTYLYDELKAQNLDLIFAYDYTTAEHDAIPLLEERLVIAMPKALASDPSLLAYAVTRDELLRQGNPPEKEVEDMSIFQRIPFLRFKKGGNTFRKMEELLGNYTTTPFFIENVRHIDMHYSMMCEGIGAVMTTDSVVATTPTEREDIVYFILKSPQARRMLYLIRRRGADSSPVIENFIAVAKELCATGRALSRRA